MPILIWNGLSVAIYAGLLVPLMVRTMPEDLSKDIKLQKASTAMIFIGIGEIIGSFVNGQVVDRLGLKKYALFNII